MRRSSRTVGTNDLTTKRNKRVGAAEKTHTEKTSVPIGKRHSAANVIQEGTLTEHVQEEGSVRKGKDQPHPREWKKQAGVAHRAGPVHPEQHRLADQRMTAVKST